MFCQNKGLSFSLSRLGAIVVTVIMCHRIINLKDVTKCLIPIPSDGGSSKFGNVEAKMTFIMKT